MNRRWLRWRSLLRITASALFLCQTTGPLTAQRVEPGPFSGLETKEKLVAVAGFPGQGASVPAEDGSRKPFALTLLAGAASGAGAGFLLGNLVQDWTGRDGAGVGLASGTLMGLVVGGAKLSGLKGFLAGVIPGYCLWVMAGAPDAFVLDPLFLLGIPGAVAGAVSTSPGR